MAAVKKIVTAGLLMALAVPTAVYGAEKAGYSQPIKDTKEQQVGEFGCEKNTEEWAKEVILTASAVPDSGKTLPEVSFTWREEQKSAASTGQTYTVRENGVYTVKLQLPESSGLTAGDIQVDVQNIDTTGPEIIQVNRDVSEWTSAPVTISVECEDYQQDVETGSNETVEETSGSNTGELFGEAASENIENLSDERAKGSGLHPEGAYSFDGGKTWTTDNFITVEENTTIDFVVRDALGNETKQTITVDNIDKSEPTVRVNIADGGALYEGESGSLLLSASASDIHSGLADQPYSWDGGVSWTDASTHRVTEPGNYTVLVRDRAGNYTQAVLTVGYSQRPADTDETGGNSSGGTNTYGIANNGGGTVYYGVPAAPITGTNNNSGNSKESERETKAAAETEKRESRSMTETETENEESEALKTPLIQNSESSGFPIRWILIGIAAAAVIIGVIAAVKIISDRQTAASGWDDEDKEDMSKVYARVSEKEKQTLGAVMAATEAVKVNEAAGDTIQLDTEVIEEAMAEAEAAEMSGTETSEAVDERPEMAESETVELPAAEAETVELPAMETETIESATMKEAVEPVSEAAAAESEPVVLEGAHSRLIYDPVTGQYKYEIK